MLDKYDIVRGGISLDTHDRKVSTYGFYSSFGFERDHHHHCHDPCRRNEKQYFLEEFRKAKPPTFDGEMKLSEDVQLWLLGMKKFFQTARLLREYESQVRYL